MFISDWLDIGAIINSDLVNKIQKKPVMNSHRRFEDRRGRLPPEKRNGPGGRGCMEFRRNEIATDAPLNFSIHRANALRN